MLIVYFCTKRKTLILGNLAQDKTLSNAQSETQERENSLRDSLKRLFPRNSFAPYYHPRMIDPKTKSMMYLNLYCDNLKMSIEWMNLEEERSLLNQAKDVLCQELGIMRILVPKYYPLDNIDNYLTRLITVKMKNKGNWSRVR